jgi:RNA polymerase sigma factor (sigma-70 family)
MEKHAHDDGVAAFFGVRRRLFGIAYRMLGSAADAEDILQDVWMRWQAADRRAVTNPKAFLATTTLRLVINLAQSARSRREVRVGFGFREPMDGRDDPGLRAERGEALELALRMLLESLSPKEQAAYILREAFGYLPPEIADVLRLTEANTRQLISRARKRIGARCRTPASAGDHRRLLEAFIAAAQQGDFTRLEGLFASARRPGPAFGLVVDDGAEPARVARRDPDVVEAGAPQRRGDDVFFEARMREPKAAQRAVAARVLAGEIHELEATPGLEHAMDLRQHGLLRRRIEVMEHERRQHAAEAARLERHRAGRALREPSADAGAVQLALRSRERLGIGIQADGFHRRLRLEHGDEQRARAAADIEHALARPELRALQQPAPDAGKAQQHRERIIQRKEQVVPGGRNERLVGFLHDRCRRM